MTETILAIILTMVLAVIYAIIRTCTNAGDKMDVLREFNLERKMMMMPVRARRRRAHP